MDQKAFLEFLPTSDLVFKKMLTSDTDRSRGILAWLVGLLIDRDVEEAEPMQTYNIDMFTKGEVEDLGHTEVDVRAKLSDGEIVTIEIQMSAQSYFTERGLHYLFAAFNNQIDKALANPYSKIKKVYGVNIVRYPAYSSDRPPFIMFDLISQKHDIKLEDMFVPTAERGKVKRGVVSISYMNLDGDLSSDKDLHDLQQFLLTGLAPEGCAPQIKDMETIVKELTKEEINMAELAYKERVAQEARMHYVHEQGVEQGIEQGIEQGQYEKTVEHILQMYDLGAEISFIKRVVKLSEEEVQAIIDDNR